MKKLLTLSLMLCVFQFVTAQRVQHFYYTATYHPGLKTCDSVSWDLTPDMVNCANHINRKIVRDDFQPDPKLGFSAAQPKDYAVNKAGTDRSAWVDKGHLFNAQDASCDIQHYKECFYMSNILPQYHGFNAGDWKTLEQVEQDMAKTQRIHILAGRIGALPQSLPAGESIPAFMYKAIYADHHWKIWIMRNDPSSKGHQDLDATWGKTLTELNQLTGLHLHN